jgi:C-methyltransferase
MIMHLYMQVWIAWAVLAAANLGVADAVEDRPRSIEEIAQAVGAHSGCLLRLLRGLAAVGVFREEGDRCFVHTPLSASLRSDAAGNARALIRMFGIKSTREAMVEYESAIRTGQSAFGLVHGSANPFDVIASRPDEAAVYHEGMSLDGEVTQAILERFEFSGMRTIVDVGGGKGTLLARILQRNAQQRGILFDLPEVLSTTVLEEHDVAERCEVRAGDMRAGVPSGGDGYILKNILHGWCDDDAVALLRRIRASGAPGTRVCIIENVMPEGPRFGPCRIFDLFLLLGGAASRVRSEKEFQHLLERSGFQMLRVQPVIENQCVVEARAC